MQQDYPDIELVISDNASTDGTSAFCEGLAAINARVRYLRNDTNVGATENFNRVRAASSGQVLMWLGDDDRLDPNYVGACVARLEDRPDASLVAGVVRYDEEDSGPRAGQKVVCDEPTGAARVRSYYRQVRDNGTFYGLAQRSLIETVPPMTNHMGNDWLLLSAYAFRGPVLAVDGVAITRSTGGATRSLRNVAETSGQSRIEAELPQLAIAWWVLRDVAWESPVYASLGRIRRGWLGCSCAAIVIGRFVIPSMPKYLRLMATRIRRRVSGSGG
jgi:glycosyltransferase involved in cell wall biosynthesis